MTAHLACRIEAENEFHCTLSVDDDRTVASPEICFSIQVPVRVLSGGTKTEGLGGFTALRLEGVLSASTPLHFVLTFENPYYVATNRAWYPQGPYLRGPSGTEDVEMGVPLGVTPSVAPDRTPPRSGLALIPAPSSWKSSGGSLAAKNFRIYGAFEIAALNVDALLARNGFLELSGHQADLEIRRDGTLPSGAYCLEIGEGLDLSASDEAGAFYGLISLAMLRETHDALPTGIIEDAPRFEWRGFMLDCVREFYPVKDICRLMDLMACLKLNRFHWHFADDEAFRLDLECAPDLAARTGFRGEGQTLPGVFGGRPGPVGGVYSKTCVQTVVQHAARLNIEVLPEIEVPAHALALTTVRPNLRDPDDTGNEASVQGYPRNVVNPEQPETWDLLEPVALEVASLFPFGHLHLGGDELPDETWAGSPMANVYKARHNLTSHQDVMGHLMHRLAGHIRAAGVTPCAWQEAADGCTGGIGHDAILFSWTGAGPGREAAAKGYRVVMCPAQHTYFDMAHTAEFEDWGANWAANYDLDQSFDWDPIPDTSLTDRIIGIEGTFWSEFTNAPKEYEAMIAPRILGLATRAWSLPEATTLDDLRRAATCHASFFETFGWDVNWASVWRDTPKGQIRRADD